ncbi:shikimate kinase [Candidatus Micrarchaeota archaeon CG08_land_8_20_14_0_20_49_17]|nr:MAG: shikimate kinase [Candidatus Micrarchaeota archaeon CG1_02_49_24]PIU09565.1 MAG: shikimate kinase [Candidatus Micrarchaeota archaeon CG08_land_8_20_14_0_20_49_17]PIU81423.1 MAG: shikimate kinase [Candidatus Micrarchaeota archaeon CG06_land_8_20_14_3_00_50_6]HII54427.1 shikimate kinase [Candidatus Micrarchaeota archaeon]
MDLFSRTESSAIAYGAGTVINAMATSQGCAFGIDLYTKLKLKTRQGEFKVKYTARSPAGKALKVPDTLIRAGILEFFTSQGIEPFYSFDVSVETNIPPAKGLKSSSSTSLALMEALNGLTRSLPEYDVLNLSVLASKAAGVTMTGAYDDACACYLGGFNVTDNNENRLVKHMPVPDYQVLIWLGKGTAFSGKMKPEMFGAIKERIWRAYEWAVNDNFYKAMRLSTKAYCEVFGYDDSIVEFALDAGAEMCGLSGKGPAFHALVKPEKAQTVIDAWKAQGYKDLIFANTNNKKAGLL